jgi:chromosome partitioning protein
MHRIAVVSRKGGVGKTTIAVNLAAALARRGDCVLLCDLDPQAAATCHLGVDYTDRLTMCEVLTGRERLDAIVCEGAGGVAVAPASTHLAVTEVELLQVPGGECMLREALGAVTARYNWVIIDTPPSLGKLTLNALVAAEWALVPALAEWASIDPVAQSLEAIEAVRNRLNRGIKVLGIVVNRVNARTRSTPVVQERLAELQVRVLDSRIRSTVRLSDALGYQEPIVTFDPGHPVTEDILSLTEEVTAIVSEQA